MWKQRILSGLLVVTIATQAVAVAGTGPSPMLPSPASPASMAHDCGHDDQAPAGESCCPADAVQSCCELSCVANPASIIDVPVPPAWPTAGRSFADAPVPRGLSPVPLTRPPIT